MKRKGPGICHSVDTTVLKPSVILPVEDGGSIYESNLWTASQPGGYRSNGDSISVTLNKNFAWWYTRDR